MNKKDTYQKLSVFHFAKEIQNRHNKKQFKCVIFGHFGAMNIGDEAILAGQIQELQKLPNVSITVAARYPSEIKRLHHVNAISMYQFGAVRKAIKNADIVIVGGGGLINKVERSYIGFLYQLYMLFAYFFLPWFYRRKLYIIGVGIYENANPIILNLVMPLVRNAAVFTVRDHHSYTFLKSKKIHSQLYKDNSFLMDLLPVAEVMKVPFFDRNFDKKREQIGISLVKPSSRAEERHLIEEMARFIIIHHDTTDFWFYPSDANPNYESDESLIKKTLHEVKKLTKEKIVLHIVPSNLTPQVFFSSMKLMNSIVAMRFHTAIFAYRAQVPFTGISYDKKCESFLESIGKKPLLLKKFTSEDIDKSIL